MFALMLSVPSGAQTTNASLSGTVTDPTAKAVPAADVTATNTDTGVAAKTKTNGDGIYLLPALQPGHYRVNVNKQGFKQIEVTDLALQVTDAATRNFHLELGAASETVTVEDSGVNINTSDASVSTVISREFVDAIPLNGRTLQNLLPIVPGIGYDTSNQGYTVNGTRVQEGTYWMVDGISGNIGASLFNNVPDTFGAPLTSLGTTQSLISLDALQEFRVSTSSYGVEYGSAPGGQIQLQSRAGTNQFHGSAYDYLRNEDLDANDWFSNQAGIARPPERQNDFGGTFGGPIRIPHVYDGRNKAFFFFSFEDLKLVQPTFLVDQPVPTAALRQSAPATLQPFLNAMPLPNGPALGDGWAVWNTASSQPSFVRAWSLRGDYALSQSTRIFARVNYSPSNQESIGDAYKNDYRINTLTATLGVITTPTPSLSNDFRVNYSQQTLASLDGVLPSTNGSNPSAAAAALVPSSQYAPPGSDYSSSVVFYDPAFDGSAVVEQQQEHSVLHQWEIVDGIKWQLGRHQLRFGGEWDRHTSTQEPVAYSQYYEFDSLASLQSSTVDVGEISSLPASVYTITTRAALYAGDTWKVNQRLSVDYGLRWELPFPTYYGGPYSPVFVNSIADPANPTVIQSRTQWAMTYRNFAPRLGIAYRLRDKGNFDTVLRIGGGLFYSTETPFGISNIGYPDQGENDFFGVAYPFTPAQLASPSIGAVTAAGLANAALIGTDPHLAVPRVWEWNATIEQRLGKNQSLTVGYVGSAGRRLYFAPVSLPASGVIDSVTFTENGSASDYNSLQVKFDRRVARGLQVLASYTWAHSIDDVSTNIYTQQPLWGNSDFDVRHSVSLAAVYSIPGARGNGWMKAATSGWELSDNFHAHTGTPVIDLFASRTFVGENGYLVYTLADLVPGVPVYLHGSQYPGGTKLNRAAFTAPPKGQQGDVPRNAIRAQDFGQDDVSLQRRFALGEKSGSLRLRVDAFNVTNHANFADYFVRNLSKSPLFGEATSTAALFNGGSNPLYNSGAARSLQLSLRYEF